MKITLYQTLEDRGNPDEVEEHGPFICRMKTAWLGTGYYFWDTHVQLGHWWGNVFYQKKGKDYIICKAVANLDETCWDLIGNGEHRVEFEEICSEIVKKGIANEANLLVHKVISYLKNNNLFGYRAIRALSLDCISQHLADPYYSFFRVNFVSNHKSYLDLRPPIQVCLLKKEALSLKNYKIVHPVEYVGDSFV